MLPQIICSEHNKEIIFLNLDPKSNFRKRTYCLACLSECQNVQPCFIEQLPSKVNQLSSDMIQTIKQEYDFLIDKIQRIKKTFITLKDNLIQIINKLIIESDQYLNQFQEEMENEIKYYRNLMKEMTIIKLEEIASLLLGNQKRDSQKSLQKIKLIQYELNVAQLYKVIRQECQDNLKKQYNIYNEQYFLVNCSEYPDECTVLDTNMSKQIIVGGVGKIIMIWKYDKFNISTTKIETYEKIEKLNISKDGSFIISVNSDQIVELWIYKEKQWELIEVIDKLLGTILDLKISPDQNFISAVYQVQNGQIQITLWIKNESSFNYFQTICDNRFVINTRVLFSDNCQFFACNCINQVLVYQIYQKESWQLYSEVTDNHDFSKISFRNHLELICVNENKNSYALIVYPIQSLTVQHLKKIGKLVSEFVMGFHFLYKENIDSKEERYQENLYLPKGRLNNQILIKDQSDKGYSFLIEIEKEGHYQIEQILDKEFIDYQSDNNGTFILRNNKVMKRIEIYKQY